MFRIGEFSKLSQVSIRMLRYYDDQGLLKPAKVDQQTGYRLYHVKQLSVLQKIVLLRDLKFSLAEIKELVHENEDTGYFRECLDKKYVQIESEIATEKKRLEKIRQTIKQIEYPQPVYYPVTFTSTPSEKVISLRKIIPDYFQEGALWHELGAYLKPLALELVSSTPTNFTIFHDEGYQEENVDLEVCLKVKQLIAVSKPLNCYQTEPIPLVASIFVSGPYQKLKEAYAYFAKWLDEHDEYEMLEPTKQISHRGPYEEENPENYLTEIQIPIKKIILDSHTM
ncbi:MerR family transcriptional regulator [Enterococcus crotali]|uniref:MerR family transcriptional regulator n=1 Tax=Enterococcus crotali TaxID=1453587 RepID=UPI00046EEFCE|nr:MerR family transcriptional regulator [Enterococcus crotali]